MREVVRAEATPEGWQAERQKLERKASLLEEQLRSSKIHQEQLREAMRAQHAQLAEAQMMAQQMREHQLRLDGDRQMRELEIEASRRALEAELRQATSEAQQLRMEQRSLQEQLTISLDHQQRAENTAAAASGSAASLMAAEARLAEHVQMVATLRQQLQTMTESQTTEAISICRGVLAVAYVNLESNLPKKSGCLSGGRGGLSSLEGCLPQLWPYLRAADATGQKGQWRGTSAGFRGD